MAESDLILETALDALEQIHLCNLTWRQADRARHEIAIIVRRLWQHKLGQAQPSEIGSAFGYTSTRGKWRNK